MYGRFKVPMSIAFSLAVLPPANMGFAVGFDASRIQTRDEKSSRTAAQKKIDSQLLYALKQKRGQTRGVPTEPIKLRTDQKGRPLVDVTCKVTPRVTSLIAKLGGVVISQEPFYHSLRAYLALEKMETLAALDDVKFIAPAAESMNNSPSSGGRVPNPSPTP